MKQAIAFALLFWLSLLLFFAAAIVIFGIIVVVSPQVLYSTISSMHFTHTKRNDGSLLKQPGPHIQAPKVPMDAYEIFRTMGGGSAYGRP